MQSYAAFTISWKNAKAFLFAFVICGLFDIAKQLIRLDPSVQEFGQAA